MNTIGIVDVWRFAATDAVDPLQTGQDLGGVRVALLGITAGSPHNIEHDVAIFNQARLTQT